ncbi:MAG: phosphoribosylanthranilate isomerase [Rhodobacteraceae bacterium]|jgi:phosphoribosylanthranilate isomerase|nr:phosphoribosylanthranilate isomerase [Paracoccaceae bacterium]NCW65615.1 phosphoribosylanthranilate isomerase [Paracoccaceae bacterium]NCX19053.1 phosphoribosylanthranilate isomerase [Paracoccaceae bacterium]NCX83880.1 phosphoribosylanthranilate isomerase [Paracoccaceae bacterium]NDD89929.1 phosphoribosylanthranilate isomerase [Paracoccaceae bacterium]
MTNPVSVKICGLATVDDVRACADAGANYMGLVFFEKSPRNIIIPAARELALAAPLGLAKVALVVNPSDAELDAITATVPLDMLQLHGRETPERVAEVKARYGLPVMKAVGIADGDDLPKLESYFGVADQILVDAKPPKGGELPGGNGLSFDWRLIAGRRWPCPWMLAGGLTPENVAEAVKMTGAKQVDVSSGVEDAPGQKNAELIQKFVQSSRA